MNFSYEIEYQNRQTKTVTVVYTPDDVRCMATVRTIQYQSAWDDEDLKNHILAMAPLEEWAQAINQADDYGFELGEFESHSEEVNEARNAILPAKTLEFVKAQKYLWVDEIRMQVERSGVPYTFPGNYQDMIQLRDERDRLNINGLSTTALILKNQGVTQPVLPFRAESNITYNMTPDQIIALGVAVSTYIASLYQIGWEVKQLIEAAQTIEEVEEVQWPE